VDLTRLFLTRSLLWLLLFVFVVGLYVSFSLQRYMLESHTETVVPFVRNAIDHHLGAEDFETPKLKTEDYESFAAAIRDISEIPQFLRIKFYDRQGRIIWSDEPKLVGVRFTTNPDLDRALKGEVVAQYSRLSREENVYERGFNYVLEAYIPLYFGNPEVFAVAEVYYGVDELFERIASTRVAIWIIILTSFLALHLLLSKIFFNASGLIVKQKEDLERANLTLQKAYLGTIKALVSAVDAKDRYTRGHSVRVAQIAVRLAESLGVGDKTKFEIQQAALLHDVGKIGIEDVILTKPGRLDPEEWEMVKKHPVIGATILAQAGTLGEELVSMIRAHHERFDGSGYPDGLMREQIPLGARIIAVADAYDAMRSNRPYRTAKAPEEVLAELEDASGTQFDPVIVEAFFDIADEIEEAIYTVAGTG